MSLILLSDSTLLLKDSVVFNNIFTPNNIISLKDNSTIIISGSDSGSVAHLTENFNA